MSRKNAVEFLAGARTLGVLTGSFSLNVYANEMRAKRYFAPISFTNCSVAVQLLPAGAASKAFLHDILGSGRTADNNLRREDDVPASIGN
jgi:hypothetical protein